ncbi:Na(+) H(+) antiporter subunit G [Caenispirillum salinarum AK4]|uniref:Na(+) H(+) antiporter subunit G n=1 Tax=Caenispirillum salinarum AK4 TaxID=1238182 RepID=K9GWD9_9PROT|nr:monovalent cation/H(+) antiporter subunit G [Caenispirillum salinarum]EKV29567.1 Na(+) H(+) antiporter subunit G [Caenispirillum salinarum AK4]
MTAGPWTDWVAAVLLVVAGLYTLGAAVGLFRMPDFYGRLHAVSVAGSVGGGAAALAVAFAFPEVGTITKALMTLVFLFLGGPVGGHLLARAAYRSGEPLWEETVIDELDDPHPPKRL